MKHIADSTVRRLSLYIRFLEELEQQAQATVSSEELARRCGTTSAQVRKDLSFFGSFGKRGLGYDVHELAGRLREILGLERDWRVIIVGAGKIGAALVAYKGFLQHRFRIVAVYDNSPDKVGSTLEGFRIRHVSDLARDAASDPPDIAVLTVPPEAAQDVVDTLVSAGVGAILNFAPASLNVPSKVALKNVNMAIELEGLAFALTNRE